MTTGSATITMVIPAYGVGSMICDALDSLLSQSCQDWLAIVVDDGDPRAADHVQPYLRDERFTFLQTDNGGPSTARNRGMSKATTDFIGLIDGDDQLDPDFLSAMLAAFTSDHVG
ncbi:MAG: glycosyltransferase family A protein, partial [Sphingobium sp.]